MSDHSFWRNGYSWPASGLQHSASAAWRHRRGENTSWLSQKTARLRQLAMAYWLQLATGFSFMSRLCSSGYRLAKLAGGGWLAGALPVAHCWLAQIRRRREDIWLRNGVMAAILA